MDGRESSLDHRRLQDEAVDWLVRRDGEEWTPEAQGQFDVWFATSAAHRVAFLRLEAGWEEARRLKALGAGHSRGAVPSIGAWDRSPFFESAGPASDPVTAPQVLEHVPQAPLIVESTSRRPWVAAAAALFLLALSVGLYWGFNAFGDRYSTPVGGITSVPLQDGSRMTLNTRTAVRVDLSASQRRIDLEQGEVFFEVAKDPQRPFVVHAGNKRIVAVGTQFSVRRSDNDVRVVVTAGTVRLETDGGPLRVASFSAGANSAPEAMSQFPLSAGTIARVSDQDLLVQSAPLPKANEMLSWRQGYLIFHDTPLGEALAEFNRYNVHHIVAADSQTASIQISGMFRPENYEGFVRLLEQGYSLEAHVGEDRTTVLRKE